MADSRSEHGRVEAVSDLQVRRQGREGILAPVLVSLAVVTAIVSSLGAPLIPTVARRFHESMSTAQWSLTVALLSGAVASPVIGRMGDGRHRKRTTVCALLVVTSGCVFAALASNMALLVVGRTMQGIGVGLVPLGMATARDEMPTHKVASTVAILSVSGAAGVGVGYPLSGLIADSWGISGAFWFGAVATGLVLMGVVFVMPSSTERLPSSRLDLIGASLLSLGLVALLVGIAQGAKWGWTSLDTVACLLVGVAVLAGWAAHQLRIANPLVDVRLLRRPAVLAANACGVILGTAMYMSLSAVVEFVQSPQRAGYGFSASVVLAGTVLVPMSLCMVSGSRLLPVLTGRLGVNNVLVIGSLEVALSSAMFAAFHGEILEAFAMMALMGAGLGVTFAAIPGLIVSAVPNRETGSALGFYQVARSIGFATGSAITAAFLAGVSKTTGLPSIGEYTELFWMSALVCVISGLSIRAIPTKRSTVVAT